MDNVRATKGHSMSAEFESVKAQGNAAFAREEYREAIRLYTKVSMIGAAVTFTLVNTS